MKIPVDQELIAQLLWEIWWREELLYIHRILERDGIPGLAPRYEWQNQFPDVMEPFMDKVDDFIQKWTPNPKW